MLFVCAHILSICTRMSFVYTRIYSHVIRMSLVCTRMSSVCHSYALLCHPYVTRMYSYVIRMSLVCARMSSICHSYVILPWTLINPLDFRDCKIQILISLIFEESWICKSHSFQINHTLCKSPSINQWWRARNEHLQSTSLNRAWS